MWNKKEKKLFSINVAIVLLASLLALYGLKGSIQERIQILQNFSFLTIKLIIKTIFFLIFGFIGTVCLLKVLNAKALKESDSKRKYGFIVAGWILYFFAFLFLVLRKWAVDRFPMDQFEVVYFTLSNVRGGGD